LQVNPANIETEVNFGTLEGSSLVVLSRILSEVRRRDAATRDRRRSAHSNAAQCHSKSRRL